MSAVPSSDCLMIILGILITTENKEYLIDCYYKYDAVHFLFVNL